MERRGREVVMASTKAHQHHCMSVAGRAEDTAPHCSCGSLRVLFRGFYLGEARIPNFITGNFRMRQSGAKLYSIIDVNADIREGEMVLGKGLYMHAETCL